MAVWCTLFDSYCSVILGAGFSLLFTVRFFLLGSTQYDGLPGERPDEEQMADYLHTQILVVSTLPVKL